MSGGTFRDCTSGTACMSDNDCAYGSSCLPSGGGKRCAGPPSPPRNVAVTLSSPTLDLNGKVRVAWDAPSFDSGNPVTGYTASATVGATVISCTATPPATTCDIAGLTNGTAYSVTVTADNANGTSEPSLPLENVIPFAKPGVPTGVTGTAGQDQQSKVTWAAAPGNGRTVTKYVVTSNPDGKTCTWTAGPLECVVSTLTNGISYTFTATAENEGGVSDPSTASAAIIPYRVPNAPTINTVVASSGTLVVTWTNNGNNGNAITSYNVSATATGGTPGTCSKSTEADTTCTISGLTNDKLYSVTMTATNAAGTSSASSAVTETPYTVPSQVSSPTVQPGDQSLIVTWTKPANNGRVITKYRVKAVPASSTGGAVTVTQEVTGEDTLTYTFTGLVNAVSYTVTVEAFNLAGYGVISSGVSRTPDKVPGQPDAPTGSEGVAQVVLTLLTPTNTGTAIINYQVQVQQQTPTPGSWTTVPSAPFTRSPASPNTSLTVTVGGLTNGNGYKFRYCAENSTGCSAYSPESDQLTPRTVPDAPTLGAVIPGARKLNVAWTPPAFNGGATISSYKAYVVGSEATLFCTVNTALAGNCDITDLTNGNLYTVAVKATNVAGQSGASSTGTGTPRTVPSAPGAITATPGDTSVALSWGLPSSTGGNAITDYFIQYKETSSATWLNIPNGAVVRSPVSPNTTRNVTVSGLTNGTAYDFQICAINDANRADPANSGSFFTATTASTTPRTTPAAPTNVVATRGDASASVDWMNGFNGGSALLGFKIERSTNGTTWTEAIADTTATTGTTKPVTVTGLTNGTSYVFRVTAKNVVGFGTTSAASAVAVIPDVAPLAPTLDTATHGNTQVTLSWTAPAGNGGTAISDYEVWVENVTAATPSAKTTNLTRASATA
ncbi:MAG: fibronectin type III domain-containing protein, partial [Deltaproteobacteria bacterium]|nr:fibronectin type III domain-containing protein [Deltaproteobacteria bacterium]